MTFFGGDWQCIAVCKDSLDMIETVWLLCNRGSLSERLQLSPDSGRSETRSDQTINGFMFAQLFYTWPGQLECLKEVFTRHDQGGHSPYISIM